MRLSIHDTWIHIGGQPLPLDLPAEQASAALAHARSTHPTALGTLYGVLHNDPAALAALGERIHQAPYKAPPKAPVLYIKPRNTRIGHGAAIPVPAGIESLHMGAALGVVIGRTACRVDAARALDVVAGYTVVNDVSVPHDDFYRPSLRHRVRDGFCPCGPWIRASSQVPSPDDLSIRLWVDGELQLQSSTAVFTRPLATLIADVTAFMTLQPGDVLLSGVPFSGSFAKPAARAGQRVAIEIEHVGRLENTLSAAPGHASAD